MISGQAGLPCSLSALPVPPCSASCWPPARSVWVDPAKGAPDTQSKTDAAWFTFFHIYFLLDFFFSVKCPGSSITYKHDLY